MRNKELKKLKSLINLIVLIFLSMSTSVFANDFIDQNSSDQIVSANMLSIEQSKLSFPNPFGSESLLQGVVGLTRHFSSSDLKDKNDELSDELAVNLLMDVKYGKKSSLNMNAVTLKTQWKGNLLDTTFYCEDSQVELGISTETINNFLPDQLKMKFKANPQAGMTAILFTIDL